MKKLMALFLAVLIIFGCAVYSSANESEEYDIIIEFKENVLRFDENAADSEAEWLRSAVGLSVQFNKIERFESCKVMIDFDKNLLELGTVIQTPVAVYSQGVYPTETGVVAFAHINDEYADRNESYSCSAPCDFKIKGIGLHNINVTVDVRDLNGEKVDVKVKYEAPYEKIVDSSEIEYIDIDESYLRYSDAYFDYGTKVSDILEKVKGKNAVIRDKNGNILEADAVVPNDSVIVTLYEGYVADAVSVCIPFDVDCDGKVTAADARLVLRKAAYLESLDGFMFSAADIDGNRIITAADARSILRKAANLD